MHKNAQFYRLATVQKVHESKIIQVKKLLRQYKWSKCYIIIIIIIIIIITIILLYDPISLHENNNAMLHF